MEEFDWREFLTSLNDKLFDSQILAKQIKLEPEVYTDAIKSRWLGFPAATEEQLTEAEQRLGITLPHSYKAFLGISNGWRIVNVFIPGLYPVEEIALFAKKHPDLTLEFNPSVPTENYINYILPEELELPGCLEVSYMEIGGTATLLLNPKIIGKDGEWEAWYFAHWIPGALKFFSFKDLMIYLYNQIT